MTIQDILDRHRDTLTDVTAALEAQVGTDAYLFKRLLTPKFSPDGKFSSTSGKARRFVMDMVSTDSPLPLKQKGSIGLYSGPIPKMGNKFNLTEEEMNQLDALLNTYATIAPPSQNASQAERDMISRQLSDTENQIAAILFGDAVSLVRASYDRNEVNLLEGLSKGVTEVQDSETVGTAIRIDYGYLSANKMDSTTAWDQPGATPVSDLEELNTRSGQRIRLFMLDRVSFNRLRKSDEGKILFANYKGVTIVDISTAPTPNLPQLNEALQEAYNFTLYIVDASFTYQRNNVDTTVNPWAVGAVVGLVDPTNVGTFQYARVAEDTRPVAHKRYQKPNEWSLIGMWRGVDPVSEFTDLQARACVMLEKVENIHHLDTTKTLA